MHPVPLVQCGISANAFEEKRDQRGPVLFRKRGKDRPERPDVVLARIIRELHAGDDDRRGRLPGPHLVDDRLEIAADLIDGNAAKRVVDSELENEDIDFLVGRKIAGSRRNPPLVVSPLEPALTTSNS
jgi:hypothetical protein